MEIQLINGQFTQKDALHILTKVAQVKIKYHEQKINTSDNEEDVKSREKRIKNLQKDVQEARHYIEKADESGVGVQANIVLTVNTIKS